MKPRQPRSAEGASLSELSNNKRIWNIEMTRSAYVDLILIYNKEKENEPWKNFYLLPSL